MHMMDELLTFFKSVFRKQEPQIVIQESSSRRITVNVTGADYHFNKYESHDWDISQFVCRRCGLTRRAAVEAFSTPPCVVKSKDGGTK